MTLFAPPVNFRRRLLAPLLLLGALAAGARAACTARDPETVGATRGYAGEMRSGECFVYVSPADIPHMVSRSYAFYDNGLLMVFSSYGEGSNSAATSAREFYFFPRAGSTDLKMDAKAERVSVIMADGDEIGIDPATAQIRSSQRGDVTVSRRMDPAERGGVEFSRYDGLLLDAGFARGRSPVSSPDGESVFRNVYGHLCKVANREIFDYDGRGEHSFKFTDAKLSAWLKKRCPGLRVSF